MSPYHEKRKGRDKKEVFVIRVKRIYDSPVPEPGDGKRILVDRLWPRGLKKEDVVVDVWMKDLAPSTPLRKWFSHDPGKWEEFKERYARELKERGELLDGLRAEARGGIVTILYSARDTEHNNGVALKELLG
jgi:uncharacterized protein YeaO (DUF488 family)